MDYGIRTVLRHFGIAGLLIGMVFTVFPAQEVLIPWMRVNALFLSGWLVAMIALGILADTAVRFEWFDRLAAMLRGPDAGPSRLAELWHKWGSCSRCVGYWSGGLTSAVAAGFYFPKWFWSSTYFLFLGASVATGVAVVTYLWRRQRIKPDEI